jgi:hypothetical protein
LYTLTRCLKDGKARVQSVSRAVTDYRLSADLNSASARNSFGISLEWGIEIQSDREWEFGKAV